jgi:hypothetical protein
MDITLSKGDEISRESLTLPAHVYNKVHILLSHADQRFIFVPVRSLHYLAVVDYEEVLFVDGHVRNQVVLSWETFQPRVRKSLTDPVPYDQVVFDSVKANEILPSLQVEFLKAVQLMSKRAEKPRAPATVADLRTRD